jgi:hypothetical protein
MGMAAVKKRFLEQLSKRDLEEGLNAEGQAMGHCVGGYCDEVAERGTKIFSLRDAKGNPHVTIETQPGRTDRAPDFYELNKEALESAELSEAHDSINSFAESPEDYEAQARELLLAHGITPKDYSPMSDPLHDIVQVKGKSNAAPIEKYLRPGFREER